MGFTRSILTIVWIFCINTYHAGIESRVLNDPKLRIKSDFANSNNVNLVTRHWVEGTDYPFPDL